MNVILAPNPAKYLSEQFELNLEHPLCPFFAVNPANGNPHTRGGRVLVSSPPVLSADGTAAHIRRDVPYLPNELGPLSIFAEMKNNRTSGAAQYPALLSNSRVGGLLFNHDGGLSDCVYFRRYGAGANLSRVGASNSFPTGTMYKFIAVSPNTTDYTQTKIYRDGSEVTYDDAYSGNMSGEPNRFSTAWYTLSSPFVGELKIGIMFAKALTSDERTFVSTNWQSLFRPVRRTRFFYSVAAGGGVSIPVVMHHYINMRAA